MKISSMQQDDEVFYSNYIEQHHESMFYHTIKYKNFIEDVIDCKSSYFIAREQDRVVGVFPMMQAEGKYGKIVNSLPYFGSHGGILSDSDLVTQQLYDYFSSTILKDCASATIITHPFYQALKYSPIFNYQDERIGQWTVLQPTEAKLYGLIDSSTRRNIRKAESSNIAIKIDNSLTALKYLQNEHKRNMSEISGNPKSDKFFDAIPKNFIAGKDYNIYTAIYQETYIAALLIFYFKDTVEYFTPATNSNYRPLQPSASIIKQAMLDAYQNGFRWWNWGGTHKTQEGVYKFKKKWGAEDYIYKYFTAVNNIKIKQADKSDLLKEYPGFFVIPF